MAEGRGRVADDVWALAVSGREKEGGAPAWQSWAAGLLGLGRVLGRAQGEKSRPGRGALGLGLVPRKEVSSFLFILFPKEF